MFAGRSSSASANAPRAPQGMPARCGHCLAGEGKSLYPNMARVERVLLSLPASSALLERDVSTAGVLGEHVELTLILSGNPVAHSQ